MLLQQNDGERRRLRRRRLRYQHGQGTATSQQTPQHMLKIPLFLFPLLALTCLRSSTRLLAEMNALLPALLIVNPLTSFRNKLRIG